MNSFGLFFSHIIPKIEELQLNPGILTSKRRKMEIKNHNSTPCFKPLHFTTTNLDDYSPNLNKSIIRMTMLSK